MLDSSGNNWHLTDDGEDVPVRTSEPTQAAQEEHVHISHADTVAAAPVHHSIRIDPSHPSTPLAAFSGIGIVLVLGTMFYFGMGNISSDILGGGATPTVTITEAGEFSPAIITVHQNDTLTIVNKNKDPQVLKAKTSDELFPLQVLFDQPFTFVVPSSAVGRTYEYYSQTLPQDKTLQIVVSSGTADTSSSVSSIVDIPAGIPIPTDLTTQTVSSASIGAGDGVGNNSLVPTDTTVDTSTTSTSSSSVASFPTDMTQVASSETMSSSAAAAIELQAAASSSEAVPVAMNTNVQIPTNFYTVGNRNLVKPVTNGKENLHGGAPLLTNNRPRNTASTGPEVWLVMLGTVLLFGFVYKRVTRHEKRS